jgi:hypothetical protein
MRVAIAAILIVLGLTSACFAAPLTPEAAESIDRSLFGAKILSNPRAILERCQEAQAKAAEFDLDPFYDGVIAECLAFAEAFSKNMEAACKHRNRALHQLRRLGASHPSYARATELVSGLEKSRSLFTCSK